MSFIKTTLVNVIDKMSSSPKSREKFVDGILTAHFKPDADEKVKQSLKEEMLRDCKDSAMLRTLYTNRNMPLLEEGTVEEARAAIELASKLGAISPSAKVSKTDGTLPSPKDKSLPQMTYRRYIPQGLAKPYPTTVYFHGGGWVIGSLKSHDDFCVWLAHLGECQVISVEYPMGPEVTFPKGHDSCFDSWQQITGPLAKDFDIDPKKCGVGGDSAGGHISALLSGKAIKNKWAVPSAQLLIYPAIHFDFESTSMTNYGEALGLTKGLMDWFAQTYLGPVDKLDPEAIKAFNDDISPSKDTPPTLMVSAALDPLFDHSTAYIKDLKKVKVKNEHCIYKGLIHNFINMTVFKGSREAVTDFSTKWRNLLHS